METRSPSAGRFSLGVCLRGAVLRTRQADCGYEYNDETWHDATSSERGTSEAPEGAGPCPRIYRETTFRLFTGYSRLLYWAETRLEPGSVNAWTPERYGQKAGMSI